MKTETVYKQLMAYVNTLSENDQTFITRMVEREETAKAPYVNLMHISNLLIALKEEMRKEYAKANGRTDALKAAKSIAKSAEKISRPGFSGAAMADGEQVFMDGFRMLVLQSPIEFATAPAAADIVDIKRNLFASLSGYDKPLDLPTIDQLKLHIATAKANNPKDKQPAYDFGDGLPRVNANYLLDMLLAIPNAKARYSGSLTAAIRFDGDGVYGFLMPCHKDRTA